MTQEDKDLLLKDLCSRLPYNVKMRTNYKTDNITVELCGLDIDKNTVNICKFRGKSIIVCDNDIPLFIGMFKSRYLPYLFPLSSMTDEMWDKEFRECGITEFTRDSFKYGCETLEFSNSNPNLSSTVKFINKLIKNHFDYLGLIPRGLALDATGLNIY